MKHGIYIIGIALLLVSCGRQQQAKSVVKDFMKEQLQKDVSYIDFSDVDSTHAFTDSLILRLRQQGLQGVTYHEYRGRTLLHIRVKYLEGQDSCSTTFYLDPEIQGVVVYKDN